MAAEQSQGRTGSGGVLTSSLADRNRRERIRALALQTIDLKNDPFLVKTRHGNYECSLCLTRHANEGSYLAHTGGKKHRDNVALREAKTKAKERAGGVGPQPAAAPAGGMARARRVTIGTPHHTVERLVDADSGQVGLRITVAYPEVADGIQPRHRFMSAFEQRHEPPSKDVQYVLFAAEPYSTIAVKIPNLPLDRAPDKFFTNWDWDHLEFTLTLHYALPQPAATSDTDDPPT